MSMILFNGDQLAVQREADLKIKVQALLAQGMKPKIAAILFTEDAGSQLYTRLKSEAAARVGIEYEVFSFEITNGVEEVVKKIHQLNQDSTITGIIIQKPWRKTWAKATGISDIHGVKAIRQAFNSWWHYLAGQINPDKDVDGLHPETLASVKDNTWQEQGRVLPATAKAILTILHQAWEQLEIDLETAKQQQILILGRSDIVGLPVFYELKNQGFNIKSLTRDDVTQRLNSTKKLIDGQVVISATGSHNLIHGNMLAENVIAVDAGEPRPDMEQASVKAKAGFMTPVPGGVGPMTVVSLLENCVELIKSN